LTSEEPKKLEGMLYNYVQQYKCKSNHKRKYFLVFLYELKLKY
jgi:hypothetical protein